ncbi:MAG: dihydrofolate reductase family protein [Acidimicrobiales bacterium]
MDEDLIELSDRYRADTREHGDGGPWLMLNMISSIDGAIAVDGVSGGLGNEADLAVFGTLRGLADAIVVGAGTARAEGYKPPAPTAAVQAQRADRGQLTRPVICLVTNSMRLDLDTPLFTDPDYRPMVITTDSADPDRVMAAAEVADVVTVGEVQVDLRMAMNEITKRTGPLILAEGGPTLNGQLAAEDLFDELCVTTSPRLVGGTGGRMLANGPELTSADFDIDRAVTARGLLFCRYVRHGH